VTLLETREFTVGYEGVPVLRDVSVTVDEGDVVALVGRNGVGKTTLLKGIMGLNAVLSGTVQFDGTDVTEWPPHETAGAGVGYIPQTRDIFGQLSVADNIRLGTVNGDWSGLRDEIPEGFYDEFSLLEEKADATGESLSGGQQQLLAIARAVVSEPRLLLLDEPTEGIQPSIISEIEDIVERIRQESDTAFLIVEQNIEFVSAVADYCYVMQNGRIVADGPTEEVLSEDVITENLQI
jgi:urea transport system ATP-binding protein